MKTHDAQNERIKRRYLTFLKEAKRFSESSLDGVLRRSTGSKATRNFGTFGSFIFNRQLPSKQISPRNGMCEPKCH